MGCYLLAQPTYCVRISPTGYWGLRMEWLFLAVLAIIWAAFLLPSDGRRTSPTTEIAEFEKKLDLLADTEGEGRWVVAPGKGMRFMSPRARERQRILERRRQVLTLLVEATTITFVIGLIPPLRVFWIITSAFGVALFGFVWMLVRLKTIEGGAHGVAQQNADYHRVSAVTNGTSDRYIADRSGRMAKTSYAGLAAFTDDDVHVVVRDA